MALDPTKVTLCWPNRIDEAALTGGSFETGLPLSLVQDRVMAVQAQTTDTQPSSTWFDITLSRARPVQTVALAAHNLTASAQYRVRIYADVDQVQLLWDSGRVDVWPAVYSTDQLEWEYDNFWSGNLDDEERGQYTPLMTVFADEIQMAHALRVELYDTSNPDGAIRLGRVFLGDAWQPAYNASYGITHGFDDATDVVEAGDRTEYFDRKRLRRTASLALEHLSEAEAYQRIYALQRTEGTSGELLYAYRLDNTPENFSRVFLARQQQLDVLAHPYFATHTGALNLLEVL